MHEPQAPQLNHIQSARYVHKQLPADGLFADHQWRIAPEPFALYPHLEAELDSLGGTLMQFYRALNLLYRASTTGRQPAWIAEWLELGKPAHIVELQRSPAFRSHIPRVIRPDLLPTDDGLKLTELDSVPGGIGLTAWLNRTYSQLGYQVIGGPEGMLQGFTSIFGNATTVHIVVSEEAATYRPEMQWLTRELNRHGQRFQMHDGTPFPFTPGDAVYRFFELFDLANVPSANPLLEAALQKQILLTPPPKTYLEEKLSLALLWNRRLRGFWRQELGSSVFDRMLALVPVSWVLDPTPLPPHAGIPDLNLSGWDELKTLSQKERALILKISGFSPEAWGARGVTLGEDLSASDWAETVDAALRRFRQSPSILQRYQKPRRVPFRWVDLDHDSLHEDEGRTRLCPYYFVTGSGDALQTQLGGVLATICPLDKKILHGMRDAAMAPVLAS